ncbi:MAG: alpha/beta hydrolase [Phycisphaerales bacterium]
MRIRRATQPPLTTRAIGLFASMLLALPGCVAIQAPARMAGVDATTSPAIDEDVIEAVTPMKWSERWGREGQRVQGVIAPVEGPIDDLRGVRLGEHHQMRTPEEERGPVERLAQGEKGVGLYRFRAEGPGAFVFVKRYEDPDHPRTNEELERLLTDADEPAEIFRYVSAESAPPVDGVPHVEIERTWFARYDAFTPQSKGLIVLLPGMFGTPEPVVESTVRYFRGQGWEVLRMLSHPSRFTELISLEIEPGESDDWTKKWGRVIAALFRDKAEEMAYATEGAVLHALDVRPNLKDSPHVLVSMSGGAMLTPTVYARAPDLYDATVLIAGGSDILEIILDSNYSDSIDSLRVAWKGRRPTRHEIDEWTQEYLRYAPFDPYHTADAMRGSPVLMLHASKDKAVPADMGEELWRRLGRPERWVYPVGHELIFLFLPTQLERIEQWIEANVPALAPEDDS